MWYDELNQQKQCYENFSISFRLTLNPETSQLWKIISYQNIVCHQRVDRSPYGICSGNPALRCHSGGSEHRSAHSRLCLYHTGFVLEEQQNT